MPYASESDLAARLAPESLILLADDNADGVADSAILDAALADATAEIDRALAGRYVTPASPAPPILTRWCADLAAENLHLRRRESLPAELADRAALARRALEAIATGLAGLAGAEPLADSMAAENSRLNCEPLFDPETLDLF